MDFSVICRVCLNTPQASLSLFETNISLLIENISSLKVSECDDLPSNICEPCAKDLKIADTVRRRIIESNDILTFIVSSRSKLAKSEQNTTNQGLKILPPNQLVIKTEEEITTDTSTIYKNSDNDDEEMKESDSESVEEEEQVPDIKKEDRDNRHHVRPEAEPETKEFTVLTKDEDIIEKSKKDGVISYYCKICKISDESNRRTNRHQVVFVITHKNRHKKARCNICGLVLKFSHVHRHIRSTHKGEPQICDVCGKTFKSSMHLWYHVWYTHKNKPMYKCEDCDKEYRSSSSLSVHKRIHTGLRPFQCDYCAKCFTRNQMLRKHINSVHLKKHNNPCEFCKKNFSSSHALKTHRRQHTGETPYLCSYCPDSFRQMVSLKTHMKSKHGIVNASKQQVSPENGENVEFCMKD